jgi:hypothetical protein
MKIDQSLYNVSNNACKHVLNEIDRYRGILEECDANIKNHGVLTTNKQGNLAENPATKTRDRASGLLLKYLKELEEYKLTESDKPLEL